VSLPPLSTSGGPSPNDTLRARVMAAVRAEPVSPRAAGKRRLALGVLRALAVWAVVSFAIGLPGLRGRPLAYVASLAVAWFLVGAAATWAGVTRGRSMLGRTAAWRRATAVLTPLALVATSFALGAVWPETLTRGAGVDRHLLCVVGTAGFALAPLRLFVNMWRESDPVAPRLTGAAIAAAAGAWGALAIELHCRFTSTFHVVVGHVLPVMLLALIGVYLGNRFLAIRA
jgi:hypothetical protein